MNNRRVSRERAVQFLFQQDYNPGKLEDDLPLFWQARKSSTAVQEFAEEIILGVLERKAELDVLIRRFSKHWKPERMNAVDKNIIRMALYEMLHRSDIPPVVSINEAVEISKKFSGPDPSGFVNGLLHNVASTLTRSLRGSENVESSTDSDT